MKKTERIGYILGLLIGLLIWFLFIYYVVIELFNRIFRNTGDPFPVLTFLAVFVILVRTGSMKRQFSKILEWINK